MYIQFYYAFQKRWGSGSKDFQGELVDFERVQKLFRENGHIIKRLAWFFFFLIGLVRGLVLARWVWARI